jgi:hypothetical protein
LEQVVKSDLARIVAFTKNYEDEFLKLLTDCSAQENQRQTAGLEKELDTLERRNAELDSLFERLYEDNVAGKISDDRFAKMSAKYENEQAENKKRIEPLLKEIHARGKRSGTAKEFLEIVKRYTQMKKLTPQILREFVEKIIVHHRQRIDGVDVQKVEIIYNCVGALKLPDKKKIPQTEILIGTRKGVALSYSQPQSCLTAVSGI